MPNTIPLALLSTRVLNVPLMITRAKLDQILSVIGSRINLEQPQHTPKAVYHSQSQSDKPYKVEDGLAIIPINGSLVHRTSGFSGWSGLVSYNSIRSKFDYALSDPDVSTILFDINSSGGEVAGVFDLVDHIYNSRGKKPIHAVSNESAYSAAYAIASAADKIYLSRTAGIGSIGVIMLHVDKSEADKQAGLKYTHIYAGAHKADGSPHKPLSDTAKTKAQSIVDSVYSLFVSTVARNNGLPAQDVIDTQADTYQGQSAVDIGLADKVLSYQEVVNSLKTKLTITGGITLMPKRDTETKLEDQTQTIEQTTETKTETQTQTQTTEQKLETPPASPPSLTFTQSDIDTATTTERERCIIILESCSLAKTPDLALDLICDGSSIETAHKMIMTVLAERTNSTTIISTVNPQKNGSINPVLADARKRAEQAKQRK